MSPTASPVGERKEQELKKSVRTAIGDNVLEEQRTLHGSPTNQKEGSDEIRVLTEADCYDELGFSFPTWKKWSVLTVIFIVQVSMNFNVRAGIGCRGECFPVADSLPAITPLTDIPVLQRSRRNL